MLPEFYWYLTCFTLVPALGSGTGKRTGTESFKNIAILFLIWKWKSLIHVLLFATPWTLVCQAPLSTEFSRTEYWSGLPCLPPGDLPNPGTEPRGLPHCRKILDCLSYQGIPRILEWVAHPFSSSSSQPRNQTGVSYTAGGFFTRWITREAPLFLKLSPNYRGSLLYYFYFNYKYSSYSLFFMNNWTNLKDLVNYG